MFQELRFIIACALFLTTAVPASAQGTQAFHYVIPKFTSTAGSELILSNLSSRLVTPQVTLLDASSKRVSTFIPVQPGTQQRLVSAAFGFTSFFGSVTVDAPAPLSVTAKLAGIGGFETLEPASSSGILVVPFSVGTTGVQELTIFNEEANATTVVITAFTPDGSIFGAVQRTIPGHGIVVEEVSALFPPPPSGATRDVAYVSIRATSNVFGTARRIYAQAEMLNFSDGAQGLVVPRADFAALNAVPSSSGVVAGTLPFFAQGSGYVTILQVLNTSSAAAASVTLTAVAPDGNVIAGTAAVTLQVPAGGAVRRSVANLFSLPSGLTVGAVTLQSTLPVIVTEAIGSETQNAFVLLPVAPAPDTNFAFTLRDFDQQFFSGFTFANPGSTAASVTLRYVSNLGEAGSRNVLTVDPFSSLTRSLAELLPEARTAGLLHVSSDVPIIAAALDGRIDNSMLANQPATHSQPDYIPPDPTKFLITGTVAHNQAPFSGVSIELSGPLNIVTTTDQNGTYFFKETPTGVYTVRPAATGYTFSPVSRTVTITSDSSRDNNFTAALVVPTITNVLPSSVVAGSTDTVIKVVATPITPASEIIFEGTPVTTKIGTAAVAVTVAGATGGTLTVLQNQQALEATIVASKLAVAHTGSLLVRTKGPGGSVSSDSASFVVGTAAPVLTSMTGVPNPLLIGNPGFTITVNGTGFTPSTTLRIGTTAVATTFVSATQLRAFVPPSLLGEGGLLKVTAILPQPTVGPSNELTVSLFNPIPGVTSISPNTTAVRLDPNSLPLEITVNGFGFAKEAAVVVDGASVPTEYRSSTQLIGFVPQTVLEAAKIVTVAVSNPPPTLGTSEALPLSLYNLVPTMTSVEAAPILFDPAPRFEGDKPLFPAQVVLRGTNFTKTGLIYVIGTPCDADVGGLTGTRISSTLIIGNVNIACTGTYRMGVVNPQPGGGLSNIVSFEVTQYTAPAAVSLAGISPVAIVAGSDTFTMTISGSNFKSGVGVNFGTAVLFPTSVTSTSIVVSVPSYLLRSSGIVPVSVTNPDVTGNSNRILFTIN